MISSPRIVDCQVDSESFPQSAVRRPEQAAANTACRYRSHNPPIRSNSSRARRLRANRLSSLAIMRRCSLRGATQTVRALRRSKSILSTVVPDFAHSERILCTFARNWPATNSAPIPSWRVRALISWLIVTSCLVTATGKEWRRIPLRVTTKIDDDGIICVADFLTAASVMWGL